MYHYVYRITNKNIKKHYYGARSSELPPKQDIGVNYFSSSEDNIFMTEQQDNPEYFKYKVVKIFNTRRESLLYETMLHTKYNVSINNNFYSNNITFKQDKHNKIILSVYDAINKLSDAELEFIKHSGLLEIKENIENNILAKDKDIIYLSSEKIQTRKELVKFFKLYGYESDITNINTYIMNLIIPFKQHIKENKGFDSFNSKHTIALLFRLANHSNHVNKYSKSFKQHLYQYFKLIVCDIEPYDYKYKYGKFNTEHLDALLKIKSEFKIRLDAILPLVIQRTLKTKSKLKEIEREYNNIISDIINKDFLKSLSIVYNRLISLSSKEIYELEDLDVKYVVSLVAYKHLNKYIKELKSSWSAKKCRYDELFINF